MIYIRMAGGLGNQMFQYAAGKALAVRHNTGLIMDTSFLRDHTAPISVVRREFALNDFRLDTFTELQEYPFGLQPVMSKGSRIRYGLKRLVNHNLPFYIKEHPRQFDERYFALPSHAYLDGYWQSEEYFKTVSDSIRKEFVLTQGIPHSHSGIRSEIQQDNTVAIFVRRQEYATNAKVRAFHGLMDQEYFLRAIAFLAEHVAIRSMFIFSDDLDWCKSNLHLSGKAVFVEHMKGDRHYTQYLLLMSEAHHFILSNSSYGWWGAWLGTKTSPVVIVPHQWYNERTMDTSRLFPPHWIRI